MAHGDCGSEGARPSPGVCRVSSGFLETVQTTAGTSKGNPGSLGVIASDFSKFCAGTSAPGGARTAHAIAGKSQRIIGLPEDIEFDSSKHHVQNPASLPATEGVRAKESLDCLRYASLIFA